MEDTSTTTVTEQPIMVFPEGEVSIDWTQTTEFAVSDVPVQEIVEAVRAAALDLGVEVVDVDHDQDPDDYVYDLLDSQEASVLERVLAGLRGQADVNEDEATLESVSM